MCQWCQNLFPQVQVHSLADTRPVIFWMSNRRIALFIRRFYAVPLDNQIKADMVDYMDKKLLNKHICSGVTKH